MKRFYLAALAMAGLAAVMFFLRSPQRAIAQEDLKKGWLEGTVHTPEGDTPVLFGAQYLPAHVRLRRPLPEEGRYWEVETRVDTQQGIYRFPDLKPGVYEVLVAPTFCKETIYRPQRIFGVLIEPGKRSILHITVHEGKENDLEEIGEPAVPTQPVIIISQEFSRLQGLINALQEEVKKLQDELKKLQGK